MPPGASASSQTGYAYVTSPTSQGQTGVRGFGGDSSGVLCFTAAGVAPTVVAAQAALDMTSCTILQ